MVIAILTFLSALFKLADTLVEKFSERHTPTFRKVAKKATGVGKDWVRRRLLTNEEIAKIGKERGGLKWG